MVQVRWVGSRSSFQCVDGDFPPMPPVNPAEKAIRLATYPGPFERLIDNVCPCSCLRKHPCSTPQGFLSAGREMYLPFFLQRKLFNLWIQPQGARGKGGFKSVRGGGQASKPSPRAGSPRGTGCLRCRGPQRPANSVSQTGHAVLRVCELATRILKCQGFT